MSQKLPFDRVAVIGSGVLGTQIAVLAAFSGYEVKVFDAREGAFGGTLEKIRSDLQAKGITPVIPWEKWDACAKAVKQVFTLDEAVKEAEMIIEAVPENLELKTLATITMDPNATITSLRDLSGGLTIRASELVLNGLIEFQTTEMGQLFFSIDSGH